MSQCCGNSIFTSIAKAAFLFQKRIYIIHRMCQNDYKLYDLFISLILSYPLCRYRCVNSMYIFLLDSASNYPPYIELDAVCQNDWCKTTEKCTLTSHSFISITHKLKINEQNRSMVTGPLYVHTDLNTLT